MEKMKNRIYVLMRTGLVGDHGWETQKVLAASFSHSGMYREGRKQSELETGLYTKFLIQTFDAKSGELVGTRNIRVSQKRHAG